VVGLLHQSKTSEREDFRADKQKVGDSIQVRIGEVKLADRRISLELPRDPNEDDWKNHQESGEAPVSALAEQLKAALAKKQRPG
jgi:ribosomal protein S1